MLTKVFRPCLVSFKLSPLRNVNKLFLKMKALMNTSQLKFFSTVLRFFSRIGNELYFEATKTGLVLRTLNSSRTCYSSVIFLEQFFTSYQTTGDEYEDNNCRIAMRPILNVLKNYKTVKCLWISFGNNEFNCHFQFLHCQLKIDSKKERLIVDVTKPKDVHIINYVMILENENLEDMNIPKEVST